MKLNKLLTARNVIMGHAQDRVNAKLAYKMMKFVKGTEDEEGFYSEKVKELIGEYGVNKFHCQKKYANSSTKVLLFA